MDISKIFKDLMFYDKDHTYTLFSDKLKSVSSIVKSFSPDIDFYKMALTTAKRRKVKVSVVLNEWEKSKVDGITLGKKIHLFGELYARNLVYLEDNDLLEPVYQELQLIKFLTDISKNYTIIGIEYMVYSTIYKYAGTIDLLLRNNKTGKFVIVDYKTNKQLHNDYGDYMKLPFIYLSATNYNKYQLQLSLYTIPFEQLGFQVEDRWIVWLMRDEPYKLYRTNNFTEMLKSVL